tara:strand:- start:524 stop:727 length:204 start_codon:yes stop_codon:yes gene_type:complete
MNVDPNPTGFFPIVQETPLKKGTITEVEEALNLGIDVVEKLEDGFNKYDALRVVLKLLAKIMRKVRR